ncbi:MAG: hypothetical protein WCG42_04750 [Parachlamydiaceae bacterium]
MINPINSKTFPHIENGSQFKPEDINSTITQNITGKWESLGVKEFRISFDLNSKSLVCETRNVANHSFATRLFGLFSAENGISQTNVIEIIDLEAQPSLCAVAKLIENQYRTTIEKTQKNTKTELSQAINEAKQKIHILKKKNEKAPLTLRDLNNFERMIAADEALLKEPTQTSSILWFTHELTPAEFIKKATASLNRIKEALDHIAQEPPHLNANAKDFARRDVSDLVKAEGNWREALKEIEEYIIKLKTQEGATPQIIKADELSEIFGKEKNALEADIGNLDIKKHNPSTLTKKIQNSEKKIKQELEKIKAGKYNTSLFGQLDAIRNDGQLQEIKKALKSETQDKIAQQQTAIDALLQDDPKGLLDDVAHKWREQLAPFEREEHEIKGGFFYSGTTKRLDDLNTSELKEYGKQLDTACKNIQEEIDFNRDNIVFWTNNISESEAAHTETNKSVEKLKNQFKNTFNAIKNSIGKEQIEQEESDRTSDIPLYLFEGFEERLRTNLPEELFDTLIANAHKLIDQRLELFLKTSPPLPADATPEDITAWKKHINTERAYFLENNRLQLEDFFEAFFKYSTVVGDVVKKSFERIEAETPQLKAANEAIKEIIQNQNEYLMNSSMLQSEEMIDSLGNTTDFIVSNANPEKKLKMRQKYLTIQDLLREFIPGQPDYKDKIKQLFAEQSDYLDKYVEILMNAKRHLTHNLEITVVIDTIARDIASIVELSPKEEGIGYLEKGMKANVPNTPEYNFFRNQFIEKQKKSIDSHIRSLSEIREKLGKQTKLSENISQPINDLIREENAQIKKLKTSYLQGSYFWKTAIPLDRMSVDQLIKYKDEIQSLITTSREKINEAKKNIDLLEKVTQLYTEEKKKVAESCDLLRSENYYTESFQLNHSIAQKEAQILKKEIKTNKDLLKTVEALQSLQKTVAKERNGFFIALDLRKQSKDSIENQMKNLRKQYKIEGVISDEYQLMLKAGQNTDGPLARQKQEALKPQVESLLQAIQSAIEHKTLNEVSKKNLQRLQELVEKNGKIFDSETLKYCTTLVA